MTLDATDATGPRRGGSMGWRFIRPPLPGWILSLPRLRPGFATSSLTRRILAINLIVLIIPIAGFFFLGQYQKSLIRQEIEALRIQAEVFAGAIGASTVVNTPDGGQRLEPARSREMLRRLTLPTGGSRARLFSLDGSLLSDTWALERPGGLVRVESIRPPRRGGASSGWLRRTFEQLVNWVPGRSKLPSYREPAVQSSADYREVEQALFGQGVGAVRDDQAGGMILSVAVPVQRYKRVLGALMLSGDSSEIEAALRDVRISILRISGFGLAATVLLSLYLSGTIGRPLSRLAASAERVQAAHGRHAQIADFSDRGDEIGDLSRSLRDMTAGLWDRMDATERFAADVAHEIKNPLTSLRSAVETTARVTDPGQQRRLMSILMEDVQRLDRLISDIAEASRVDAEMSRLTPEPVDTGRLLAALVETGQATAGADAPRLRLHMSAGADLTVMAFEGRIGQVFRNVIGNALSFSPPGGTVACHAWRRGDAVHIAIADEGPGIPPNKLEDVFKRFYSDRPGAARRDNHSGLGLSISRQIVRAVGGEIRAENRLDKAGRVRGARFLIALPAARAGQAGPGGPALA